MQVRNSTVAVVAALALVACNKTNQGKSPSTAPAHVKIEQASPPPGGSWADVVNTTSGGFMMGNPNAKVKLVEIGSLFCPVCKRFEDEGVPPLVSKYVKSGQVSWEFRPYIIHGPIDMAANLIARCNGPKTFFPIAQSLYHDQAALLSKLEATPKDKVAQIQTLPTQQIFVGIANVMGLQDWAAARGVSQAKTNQCLSDEQKINNEVQLTADVNNQYPDFVGTPSFIINGTMLKETSNWDKLRPQLDEALK